MSESDSSNEKDFLSDRVRELFQQAEATRQEEIGRIAGEKGLDADAAELEFYRRRHAAEEDDMRHALTYAEFLTLYETGNFEFEGYIIKEEDLAKKVYVHMKRVNVEGVQIEIWAEEHPATSYECTSPAHVRYYRVNICDYDDPAKGITFALALGNRWKTKEDMMGEFDHITDEVRKRTNFLYFEARYGKLGEVEWPKEVGE